MKTVICTACGKLVPAELVNDHLPDNGWSLDFSNFGYYGGFTDEFNETPRWKLCHDCVVKLLALFPLLGETINKGGHSCDSEQPCCEWAWRPKDIFGEYTIDADGMPIPVPGVHYQLAQDGKWVDQID